MTKHVITARIYDKRGRLLTQATNNYTRSHPLQASFARKAGQPARIYLHAEIAALVKLRAAHSPYKMVVERLDKEGRSRLAEPCPVCKAAIKHWGIEKVEFTRL
jgi:tRNA(Arg) A34 adenosine deaminase TadA